MNTYPTAMSYSPFQNEKSVPVSVCSISLNMTDRLRLIGVPPGLTPNLREAIQAGWSYGIQEERDYYGAHEFKLSGNPWVGTGDESVKSRRLLTYVLICMARHGWVLLQSADVSKQQRDKDTLFFESAPPDPEATMFAVTFNMGDRIRVIDAPSMMPYAKAAVEAQWRHGIQKEKEYYGSQEIKLAGNPWYPNGSDAVLARLLLNQVIANFRTVGYKLYASVDVSIGAEGRDLESWIFRKVGPAWQ